MLLFLKLVYETQILKPSEPTKNHSSIKLLILLSLRADLLCTLQYETPRKYPLDRWYLHYLGKVKLT